MSHAEIALQEELREAVKEMAKRRIEIERLRAVNAKLRAQIVILKEQMNAMAVDRLNNLNLPSPL